MRRMVVVTCLIAVSACATPDRDASAPQQCPERNASVTLSCVISREGSLSDCRVVRESAPGCGFAEAALESAAKANIRPTDWREGQRIQFTTRFQSAD